MALTSAITIDQVPAQVAYRTVILTGRNSADIATIVVTGAPVSVVQPTPLTWRAELRLSPGTNRIAVSGIDIAGNTTASLEHDIELLKLVQVGFRSRNVLDEHGTLLGVPRLPGEKNFPYLNRLKDAGLRPTDITVQGVTYAASRGLALRVRNALRIVSPRDVDTQQSRAVDGYVRIGPVYLELHSVQLRADECHRVEPATQTITLDAQPVDQRVRLVTLNGDEVPPDLFEVDVRRRVIHFRVPDFNGIDLRALYRYAERISLLDRTLGQLQTAIEAVTDADGDPLFTVTLLLPTTSAAENLIPTKGRVAVRTTPRVFEASPLRVRELWQYDFQQRHLNDRGHAIGTKLAAWAQQINTQARVVWDATFLGESFWEPLGEDPRLGVLPHLLDAHRGYWRCLQPTDGTRYTLKDYRTNNGLCPVHGTPLEYHGILPLEFQSGTGTGTDLRVRDIVAVPTEG